MYSRAKYSSAAPAVKQRTLARALMSAITGLPSDFGFWTQDFVRISSLGLRYLRLTAIG